MIESRADLSDWTTAGTARISTDALSCPSSYRYYLTVRFISPITIGYTDHFLECLAPSLKLSAFALDCMGHDIR